MKAYAGPNKIALLNSFSPVEIQRGVHRSFVDTIIPLGIYKFGAGFVRYRAPEVL
jgi:hypothetical protein